METSTSLTALEVLGAVLQEPGSWGVSDLSRALSLPKPRVHRHLTQLKAAGYLSQNELTKRYEPGWKLLILGQQINRQASALAIAQPAMQRLRDEVRQTIVFGQVANGAVTVMSVLPGGSPIDVVLHPGTQFGFNSSAQGKVALAFGSANQLESWGSEPFEVRTQHTVMDPEHVAADVSAARVRGWAAAPEETYLGVNALAAPVFNDGEGIFGTLAIIASIHFVPADPPEDMVNSLLSAAGELSRNFGYAGTSYPPTEED